MLKPRWNQVLDSPVISNLVDVSIVKAVPDLFIDKSQFISDPSEGSSKLFTTNPNDPQQVVTIGSTMTFANGNSNNVNGPDLQ